MLNDFVSCFRCTMRSLKSIVLSKYPNIGEIPETERVQGRVCPSPAPIVSSNLVLLKLVSLSLRKCIGVSSSGRAITFHCRGSPQICYVYNYPGRFLLISDQVTWLSISLLTSSSPHEENNRLLHKKECQSKGRRDHLIPVRASMRST